MQHLGICEQEKLNFGSTIGDQAVAGGSVDRCREAAAGKKQGRDVTGGKNNNRIISQNTKSIHIQNHF